MRRDAGVNKESMTFHVCANSQQPQGAFSAVAGQLRGVLHCIGQGHWSRGQNGDSIHAKRIDNLVAISKAASERHNGQPMALGQVRDSSYAFAVRRLRVQLSLRGDHQVGRVQVFFKLYCFQHNLRAGTQRGMEEGQQTCSQSSSSTRSRNVTHTLPKVALNDLSVMSERRV